MERTPAAATSPARKPNESATRYKCISAPGSAPSSLSAEPGNIGSCVYHFPDLRIWKVPSLFLTFVYPPNALLDPDFW